MVAIVDLISPTLLIIICYQAITTPNTLCKCTALWSSSKGVMYSKLKLVIAKHIVSSKLAKLNYSKYFLLLGIWYPHFTEDKRSPIET